VKGVTHENQEQEARKAPQQSKEARSHQTADSTIAFKPGLNDMGQYRGIDGLPASIPPDTPEPAISRQGEKVMPADKARKSRKHLIKAKKLEAKLPLRGRK
jgi:hypothetical protein